MVHFHDPPLPGRPPAEVAVVVPADAGHHPRAAYSQPARLLAGDQTARHGSRDRSRPAGDRDGKGR